MLPDSEEEKAKPEKEWKKSKNEEREMESHHRPVNRNAEWVASKPTMLSSFTDDLSKTHRRTSIAVGSASSPGAASPASPSWPR
ncbi:hypothetical protein PIB30_063522 [Stylosanthes scabra]|uniref:Uncharacterized protein n=1 Tax=Stylosanthes scabra TaxID=79078 RepID=A0ABU6XJD0_9FABA|nr:hypothetical protein [Stylosanthes scabra]